MQAILVLHFARTGRLGEHEGRHRGLSATLATLPAVVGRLTTARFPDRGDWWQNR